MATQFPRTSSPISSPTLAEDLSKLSLDNDSECDVVLQVNDGGVAFRFTGTPKSATSYTLSVRTEENGQVSSSLSVRGDTSISESDTSSFAATLTPPRVSTRKTSTPRRPPPPLSFVPHPIRPGIGLGVPPQRQRSISSPTLPQASSDCTLQPLSSGKIQCSGSTQGKGPNPSRQCRVGVHAGRVLSHVDPDHDIKRYCSTHRKKMLEENTGFYPRSGSKRVNFSDWIMDYLNPQTRVSLMSEMTAIRRRSNQPGYVYAYQIEDPNAPDKIHLKVGCSIHVNNRLQQWDKQCSSKQQEARGWWPRTVEAEDGELDDDILLKGNIHPGEAGPRHMWLEKLVHLELADLAIYKPYLDPEFPNIKKAAVEPGTRPRTPSFTSVMAGQPCSDCGVRHKEIFSFTRTERGMFEGDEWNSLVKPVIKRWGRFVRMMDKEEEERGEREEEEIQTSGNVM